MTKGKITYMIRIWVDLAKNGYEIRVGSDLLPKVGLSLKHLGFSGKAVIITDTNVRPLYADILQQGLLQADFGVTVLETSAGESQKTLTTAGQFYQSLADVLTERNTVVLALGGGVIGDLAGFVAATYMRGVPLVQVPTSLLAMVDSSVGGKTAVDCGNLKNMIGAFYQPKLVVADVTVLKTLPKVELASGMGEVIKHAVIRDRGFYNFLQKYMTKAMDYDISLLETIVRESARIKASIVSVDEKETGPRILLNFGHTVGHALESVTDFQVKHGQAVTIGMMAAARISHRLGLLREKDVEGLSRLITQVGMPVDLPPLNDTQKENLLELIKHDKKVRDDKVRFVLLRNIGRAFISDKVEPDLLREVLFGAQPT
jgi:3-dehydroquinate synthase